MASYDDVEAALWRCLPMGQNYSMPVPVVEGGKLYDVVFTYATDRKTHEVGAPLGFIRVDAAGDAERAELPSAFAEVEFEPAALETPAGYAENTTEAESLYEAVHEEASVNETGPASERYAGLVWATTQKSLRPYYKALSPDLFADCQ